jgi:hypothetical protein
MRLSAKLGVFEFDGDTVRLTVVKTGGKQPAVLACLAVMAETDPEVETTEGRAEALAEAVRLLVKRAGGLQGAAMLCADGRDSVVRPLRVPFKGSGRVAAAVPYELEPYLAFPIDELAVDHVTVGETDGKTDVLAVGLRMADLAVQLAALESAGVNVEGIGLDLAGLTNLWAAGTAPAKGAQAVLHVRPKSMALAVLRDGRLVLFRTLPHAAETLSDASAHVLRQISTTLRSLVAGANMETQPDTLAVTGAELDPAARAALEEAVGIPVACVNLADRLRFGDKKKKAVNDALGDPTACAAAAGIALGAAGSGVTLNFLKGSLVPAGMWRGLALHAAFTGVLVAVLLLAWAGYCVVDYQGNKSRSERIGRQIWNLYAEAFPESETVKAGRPANDIGGFLSSESMRLDYENYRKESIGFNAAVLSRPTLLDLLVELDTRLGGDKVILTDLVIRSDRSGQQQVTIVGEVKDPGAFQQEFELLRQSELLKVTGEPRVSAKPDKTTFTITATF